MNIEEQKRQRILRRLNLERMSLPINEVSKDLKSLKVSVQFTFLSAVLTKPMVEEYSRTLTSKDLLFLHYDCVNPDCTSDGFNLTNALREALVSRECVEGEMHCAGKEDWKYRDASGCSCRTILKYKIEPEFESL